VCEKEVASTDYLSDPPSTLVAIQLPVSAFICYRLTHPVRNTLLYRYPLRRKYIGWGFERRKDAKTDSEQKVTKLPTTIS
jgi:hypothetical protein